MPTARHGSQPHSLRLRPLRLMIAASMPSVDAGRSAKVAAGWAGISKLPAR